MTTTPEIPVFYHPTNLILLDDDPRYLNDVSLILDASIPYVLDSDPAKIQHYLKLHTYKSDDVAQHLIKPIFADNNLPETDTFSINFSWLIENLKIPERFKKATVALIDRRMKKIDGLNLCAKIRDNKTLIDLILFTGQTTLDEAVTAFNDQIIDGFLVKSGDPESLVKEINKIVFEHNWRFFTKFSQSLLGALSNQIKPLYDQQFAQVFHQVKKQCEAVEFYLVDSSGSFLLVDADGAAKQLFVRSKTDFDECLNMAKDAEAPTNVIRALQDYQQFPYSREAGGYIKCYGDDAWQRAMIQMDKIPGRDLFYAVVDRSDIKPFSFEQYRSDVWPEV